MNETMLDAAALPPKKNKDWVEKVFLAIVGSNEQDVVRPYAPYYPNFDLFPPKPLPPFWIVAIASALIGIMIVGTATLLLDARTEESKNRAAEVERNLTLQKTMAMLVEKTELQKKEAKNQMKLFKSVDDRLFYWSHALDIFRCLTPSETRLISLKGNSSGQILVDGQSRDLTSIGYLMLNLRASGLFYKPKLFTTQLNDQEGQKLFHFTLSTELLNPASVSLPVGGTLDAR